MSVGFLNNKTKYTRHTSRCRCFGYAPSPEASLWLVKFVPDEFVAPLPLSSIQKLTTRARPQLFFATSMEDFCFPAVFISSNCEKSIMINTSADSLLTI
ncbi:MAG: hypothetical protein ACRCZ6_06610 [Kluyvera sp.]|uniref:hypothetical protein n=1 Tax=Kluyvera sp. TaxID=1538228 RepID=UPI003F32B711